MPHRISNGGLSLPVLDKEMESNPSSYGLGVVESPNTFRKTSAKFWRLV